MPASSLTVTLSSAFSRTFRGEAASEGGFTPPQRAGSLRGAAQHPSERERVELILVILPFALLFAGVALALFVWAARSGQFDDLETPAVRILFDDETHPRGVPPPPRARRRQGETLKCADSKPMGILIVVAAVAATGWLAWALSYARQGYEPRQPIQFRHSRMAGPAGLAGEREGRARRTSGATTSPACTATPCPTRAATRRCPRPRCA